MISRAQFQPLANKINAGGGFSHKVAGPNQGQQATDGYMVGLPGYGKDFPINKPVTGADLEQHAVQHSAVFSQPDVYMGGWLGQNPTRASVDASVRFDRSPSGMVSARDAATIANQEAIGEVDVSGGYVGEINNPYYREERGHSERMDPTLFEHDWAQTGNVDPAAVGALAAGKPITQKKRRKR
jgi:hypothetical protein